MKKNIYTPRKKKLCDLLREKRENAGISQVELGQKLSIPQTYVSKYERGQKRLDIFELIEICNAIGIDIKDIIDDILLFIEEGK